MNKKNKLLSIIVLMMILVNGCGNSPKNVRDDVGKTINIDKNESVTNNTVSENIIKNDRKDNAEDNRVNEEENKDSLTSVDDDYTNKVEKKEDKQKKQKKKIIQKEENYFKTGHYILFYENYWLEAEVSDNYITLKQRTDQQGRPAAEFCGVLEKIKTNKYFAKCDNDYYDSLYCTFSDSSTIEIEEQNTSWPMYDGVYGYDEDYDESYYDYLENGHYSGEEYEGNCDEEFYFEDGYNDYGEEFFYDYEDEYSSGEIRESEIRNINSGQVYSLATNWKNEYNRGLGIEYRVSNFTCKTLIPSINYDGSHSVAVVTTEVEYWIGSHGGGADGSIYACVLIDCFTGKIIDSYIM